MKAYKFIASALKDIVTFLAVGIHVAAIIFSASVPVTGFDELGLGCLQ